MGYYPTPEEEAAAAAKVAEEIRLIVESRARNAQRRASGAA